MINKIIDQFPLSFWRWMSKKNYLNFIFEQDEENKKIYKLNIANSNETEIILNKQFLIGYMVEYLLEKEDTSFKKEVTLSNIDYLFEKLKEEIIK